MRDAVQKVAGAVERIDHPARLVGIAENLAALFEQEAPVRPRLDEFPHQRFLSLLVGHGHEIGGTFAADLKMRHFAEIAAKLRRDLTCRALDDRQKTRM